MKNVCKTNAKGYFLALFFRKSLTLDLISVYHLGNNSGLDFAVIIYLHIPVQVSPNILNLRVLKHLKHAVYFPKPHPPILTCLHQRPLPSKYHYNFRFTSSRPTPQDCRRFSLLAQINTAINISRILMLEERSVKLSASTKNSAMVSKMWSEE